jgi:HTH-type transcriptional regulator / antitoxin HigA
MDIKPIQSEADYTRALGEVERYFDNPPEPASAAGDRFVKLLALIEEYEALHYPIAPPDPIEAIKFRMEQSGLKAKK